MNLKRKKELLKKLDQKIKEAQSRAAKTLATAKDFRFASRSQQGDKLYFQNAAKITEDQLLELLELKKEIEASPEKSPLIVEPNCFVLLQYQTGQESGFYFINRGAKLSGFQLITPESPLGKSILGKKPGEKFSYQITQGNQTAKFSGRIKTIE